MFEISSMVDVIVREGISHSSCGHGERKHQESEVNSLSELRSRPWCRVFNWLNRCGQQESITHQPGVNMIVIINGHIHNDLSGTLVECEGTM